MGSLYEDKIYPKLMEWNLTNKRVGEQRRDILSQVNGRVLEIGFGTGMNVEFYPEHIKKITAIDSNEAMENYLKKKLGVNGLEVEIYNMSAENLDFDDASFDCVVSTFTLCTIENTENALSEIYRVLKPGGRFFFLEHGKSPGHLMHCIQNLTNPLFNMLACGCNVNRDIKAVILGSDLVIEKLESFYLNHKISGYTYKGSAVKPK